MCSVNDDEENEVSLMVAVEKHNYDNEPCRKCKKLAVVLLLRKFPYCRDCFCELVSHRFYRSLGKSKLMRPSDRVLLMFSGSQSSSVLTHLVHESLKVRQKPLISDAIVLYIDDSCCVEGKRTSDVLNTLKPMFSIYGLKLIFVPLNYLGNSLHDVEELLSIGKADEFFDVQALFNSLKTSSAKEDMLNKLLIKVSVKIAKELNFNKIFTAETGDHIAAKVLTNLALGRASQIPRDIEIFDNRYKDVLIGRPLRECSRKEIAFFLRLNNIPSTFLPKITTLTGKSDSVQQLTEKFVADLQISYPSTISTVVSTGNKLTVNSKAPTAVCPLCKCAIDMFEDDDISAEDARELSHKLSTFGKEGFDDLDGFLSSSSSSCWDQKGTDAEEKCCGNNCQSSKNTVVTKSPDLTRKTFCYGCRLILNDLGNYELLPREILGEATQTALLEEMRTEIQDFLL